MARSRRNAQLPLDLLFNGDGGKPLLSPSPRHATCNASRTSIAIFSLLCTLSIFSWSLHSFPSPPQPLLPSSSLLPPPAATRSVAREDLSVQNVGREDDDDDDDDATLAGLLADDADRVQCKSRGAIHRYRPRSKYIPSPYLVSRLRKYEALHRKCAPGTANFNKTVDRLLKNKNERGEEDECRYIVWISYSGLGNRLVSIASAFVFALLTDRVLLLDARSDFGELLCEPFPRASWLLPPDFTPLTSHSFNESSPHRFGRLLEEDPRRKPSSSSPTSSRSPPPLLSYLHLTHNYDFYDKLLFCDEEQAFLHHVPWLFLRSNQYFVPSLYIFIPQFREELNRLFPERDAIFHHIGRYLFHPTNSVWSWITRFYHAYLAKASQRIGIQIRTFVSGPEFLPYITEQILTCGVENKVLPRTTESDEHEDNAGDRNSTAVLVTSLLPDYFEKIRELYMDHATESGGLVSVYQPSHEIHQQSQKHGHNRKAWAEICLLSFSDKLITSPLSTFGYVAQGLAGIKPWILARVENETVPSFVCSRTLSMDPCFHAPPYFDCMLNRGTDTSKILPFVQHCEDVSWGLKIF